MDSTAHVVVPDDASASANRPDKLGVPQQALDVLRAASQRLIADLSCIRGGDLDLGPLDWIIGLRFTVGETEHDFTIFVAPDVEHSPEICYYYGLSNEDRNPFRIYHKVNGEEQDHDCTMHDIIELVQNAQYATVMPDLPYGYSLPEVFVAAVQYGWDITIDGREHQRQLNIKYGLPDSITIEGTAFDYLKDEHGNHRGTVDMSATFYEQKDGKSFVKPLVFKSIDLISEEVILHDVIDALLQPAPYTVVTADPNVFEYE